MGKGDLRTKTGKRIRGSFGRTRAKSTKLSVLEQLKVNIEKRFGAKAEKKAE
jgi:ribosomal small subunit protein bTHX